MPVSILCLLKGQPLCCVSEFLEKMYIPCLLKESVGPSPVGLVGTTFRGDSVTFDLVCSTLEFFPGSPGLFEIFPELHTRGSFFYFVFLRFFFFLKRPNIKFLSPELQLLR